ncbi:MAG: HAMP domain-containing histidine kinase, partial [Gemmatimonadetes bacterium]|nr:HAMP domain-containing histidine kinase [Gemmatimonadota bacterium]
MPTTARSAESLDCLRLANLARLREVVQSTLIHDARGPLNAATLELDLLRQGLDLDDWGHPGVRVRALESIETLARELSRVNSGLSSVAPLPDALQKTQSGLDPCDVWEEAVRLTRQRALLRGVRVEVSRPESAPRVQGGHGPLLQAALNVLLNALEASSSGGVVRIATTLEGGRARTTVTDAGEGVAAADLERVFEARFTRKPDHDGLG